MSLTDEEARELGKRAVALPAWRWADRLPLVGGGESWLLSDGPYVLRTLSDSFTASAPVGPDDVPDLRSPLWQGWVESALREAEAPFGTVAWLGYDGGWAWMVATLNGRVLARGPRASSREEALVAALELR